jgi:hypothetical protein
MKGEMDRTEDWSKRKYKFRVTKVKIGPTSTIPCALHHEAVIRERSMNYHDKGIIEGIAWRKQKLIVRYQLGGLAAWQEDRKL